MVCAVWHALGVATQCMPLLRGVHRRVASCSVLYQKPAAQLLLTLCKMLKVEKSCCGFVV
jgi:hypothetical protein